MPAHHQRALALLGSAAHCLSAHVVERDIPEVAIEAGDLIVHAWGSVFPRMGGRVRYLSVDDYEALRAATLDSYREAFVPLIHIERKIRLGLMDWDDQPEAQWRREYLYEFLKFRNKWGKGLKVWHSRLAVARPCHSRASEPIHASSDESALFELIHSSGGRMPRGAS